MQEITLVDKDGYPIGDSISALYVTPVDVNGSSIAQSGYMMTQDNADVPAGFPPSYVMSVGGVDGSGNAQWLKVDPSGFLKISIAAQALNPLVVADDPYSYNHISTLTTTTVKSGAGFLHAIAINTTAATGTATIYDSLTGSGTKIAVVTVASLATLFFDVAFTTGLTIVTATAAHDLTVSYR